MTRTIEDLLLAEKALKDAQDALREELGLLPHIEYPFVVRTEVRWSFVKEACGAFSVIDGDNNVHRVDRVLRTEDVIAFESDDPNNNTIFLYRESNYSPTLVKP